MRVLLVDDHPLFIDGLKFILEDMADISVCEVSQTSEGALHLLQTDTNYDLILLDLNMPGIDGIDFLQTLNNRKVCIPTVALSATEDIRLILSALQAGAFGFIPKSFNKDELKAAISTVLEGEVFIPPSLEVSLSRAQKNQSSQMPYKQFGITKRQSDVLSLLAKGQSNKQIATTLFISEHTVKFHVAALLKVFNVSTRADCILKVREHDL